MQTILRGVATTAQCCEIFPAPRVTVGAAKDIFSPVIVIVSVTKSIETFLIVSCWDGAAASANCSAIRMNAK